jgi:hypothetical protein
VFLRQGAGGGGRLLGQDLEVETLGRHITVVLGVLMDGWGLASQVDVEHLVRHTDQVRATRIAHGARLLSKLFLIRSRGVLSSLGRLNEVVGQALDQVFLPRQALGGLRRLVGGLVKDPTRREVLRTREIGLHVIRMGRG